MKGFIFCHATHILQQKMVDKVKYKELGSYSETWYKPIPMV